MRRRLISLCVLALVLGGCAREAEPNGPRRTIEPSLTASSPSASASAKESVACKLLTSDERKSIAGERIDIVAPVLRNAEDTDQCRWVKDLRSSAPPTVQVVTSSAKTWAKQVPRQVNQVMAGGRLSTKMVKKLLDAKKTIAEGHYDNAEACRLFTLLAEANGDRKGAHTRLSYPPYGRQGSANARTCTHGVFTQVSYAEVGLKPYGFVGYAVLRLLKLAHKRAIKLQ